MTVTLEILEPDNDTVVTEIAPGQFRRAKHAEVNSRAGGWELDIPVFTEAGAANPVLPELIVGRIIRFTVDGNIVGAGVVSDDELIVIASEEDEAGEIATLEGDGLAAVFEKVKVRPDAGMSNKPFDHTRSFNHSADRLRDDDPDGPQGVWALAYGQLPNYDTDNYFGRPEGFTDTAGPDGLGTEWLWNADTRTDFADVGVVYFRQRFTLDDPTDMLFEFAADDNGELWVDNVLICKTEGVFLGKCAKAGVRLTAGEHLIAVKGTNLNGLRAGVVYAGWSVTDGMPKACLVRSDSSLARCLAYPDDPPGFTQGEIPRLVVDEVQSLTNPRLPAVTFSFTSANATDGTDFTEIVDVTCNAPGDTILTLLEMLGETALDWSVTPGPPTSTDPAPTGTIELNAWVRGTRGADRSATVIFNKGNSRRVAHQRTGSDRATIALVIGKGYSFVVAHPDADTFGIYEEVTLDFGTASQASAAKFAMEYLNVVSRSRNGVSLELVPGVGPIPYIDFWVGDTITIPGRDGSPTSERVAQIGFEVGTDGVTHWTIDLDQPRQIDEERQAAIMRRQLPGGVGGRSLMPAPAEPSPIDTKAGAEEALIWQWDGPLGDIQFYKNGTAITDAVVSGLVAVGDTNKATLMDPEREYVHDVDYFTFTAGGSTNQSPRLTPPKGRWAMEARATCDENDDGTHITISLLFEAA